MTKKISAFYRPTWAEINLDNLRHNLSEIQHVLPKTTEVMAVVKADCYGHGMPVARCLYDSGVRNFAVACLDEAVVLRHNVPADCKIYVLGFTGVESIPMLVEEDIIPTVIGLDFAEALSDYCAEDGIIHPVHVKIDTGMNRIGFHYAEALSVIHRLKALPGIFVEGLFTHFATADAKDKAFFNLQQSRFETVLAALVSDGVRIPVVHTSNSGAIIDCEKAAYHMARPGIILYGYYPSDEVQKKRLDLKPVMSLKTKIDQIKKIQIGESVSYGQKFIAERPTIIGSLPIGYADGYTRMISGKGAEVWIGGQQAKVVGNICMDQTMIDLTELQNVNLYDEVELFGEHYSADRLAEILGTISYEILCMVGKRIPRVYIDGGKVVETATLTDVYPIK